ncbi:hypothetical protein [Duganella phyllosphaerae]|uniref:Uncharacterized protein n=1 Tax=Duganella phyllosphaerae TaxID=762836 RepID=A0A1E7WID5_9BURK|nr:hypothetical protein [Duganella phyllosphaerae]OEZ98412.1 hypothetical protein DUPY_30910 [Duganella phyllosphaerae]
MTLIVKLDYYDNSQKKLLLNSQPYVDAGTSSKVAAYQAVQRIRMADFYSYFLIHRQDLPDFQTYSDRLQRKVAAIEWLRGAVSTTSGNVRLVKAGYSDRRLSETIGEAIGLSVVSRLHDLTDADWTKLDELSGEDKADSFDFEVASDGVRIIQVEAKGSFVVDSNKKPSKVSNLKKNIVDKKISISAIVNYPYPASVRYGTIAAVDAVNGAKCWILDPDAVNLDISPQTLRIAKRLGFIAKLISLIAPNATLPKVIYSRIGEILERGSSSFDGKILEQKNGYHFSTSNYVERYLSNKKIYLKDIDVIGKVYSSSEGIYSFIGMRGDLARRAISQNFDDILSMNFSNYENSMSHEFQFEEKISGSVAGATKKINLNFSVSSGGFAFGTSE